MKKIFILICMICFSFMYSDDIGIERLIRFNPTNLKEIQTYMNNNFHYIDEKVDHWSAPSETMRNNGGDCEDYAIFVMYYASRLGYPVTFVAVKTPEDGYHALVIINGVLFDPQGLIKIEMGDYKLVYTLSLEDCLKRCHY